MKRSWPLVAALAALVLVASACDLKPPANATSSPSPSQLPSPSPEPTPVVITSLSFHAGEVTVAYAPVAMAATGGTPPYQWTVGAGALPDGLTMSPDGTVSGTPGVAGSFTFTVHVADTSGRSFDVGATIPITAAPSASLTPACAQYCAVEQGCDSTCGAFGTLSGGTAPFTYSLQGGYVPKGVSLSGLALVGTFTSLAKFWQFAVLVTDALGATTTITPTFYVYPHIYLSTGTCTGDYAKGCTVSLPYSGGTPAGTPTIAISNVQCSPNYCNGPPNTLPPAFSATVSGGYVTITFPSRMGSGWKGSFDITLTDHSVCAAGTACSTGAVTVAVDVVGG